MDNIEKRLHKIAVDYGNDGDVLLMTFAMPEIISLIDDLQRQAFEAGREVITFISKEYNGTSYHTDKYPTYNDYTNSLTDKNGDNG